MPGSLSLPEGPNRFRFFTGKVPDQCIFPTISCLRWLRLGNFSLWSPMINSQVGFILWIFVATMNNYGRQWKTVRRNGFPTKSESGEVAVPKLQRQLFQKNWRIKKYVCTYNRSETLVFLIPDILPATILFSIILSTSVYNTITTETCGCKSTLNKFCCTQLKCPPKPQHKQLKFACTLGGSGTVPGLRTCGAWPGPKILSGHS